MRPQRALFIATLALISLAFAPAPIKMPDLSKEGIARVLKKFPKDEDAIQEFFVLTLERKPKRAEIKWVLPHVQKPEKDRQQAYEDVVWALTNSLEYLRLQKMKAGAQTPR